MLNHRQTVFDLLNLAEEVSESAELNCWEYRPGVHIDDSFKIPAGGAASVVAYSVYPHGSVDAVLMAKLRCRYGKVSPYPKYRRAR